MKAKPQDQLWDSKVPAFSCEVSLERVLQRPIRIAIVACEVLALVCFACFLGWNGNAYPKPFSK